MTDDELEDLPYGENFHDEAEAAAWADAAARKRPWRPHRRLYMSTTEGLDALESSGFQDAKLVWSEHQMALYRARV